MARTRKRTGENYMTDRIEWFISKNPKLKELYLLQSIQVGKYSDDRISTYDSRTCREYKEPKLSEINKQNDSLKKELRLDEIAEKIRLEEKKVFKYLWDLDRKSVV